METLGLTTLIGSKVIGFEPVHDYWFLTLDRATICLHNPVAIIHASSNEALPLADAQVVQVRINEGQDLTIWFSGDRKLVMSLRPEDYIWHEAAVINHMIGGNIVAVSVIP